MTEQDAAARAREVGDQVETQVNEVADAGAAQADALAGQAEQQLDAAQESAQDLAATGEGMAQDVSDTLRDAGQDAQAPAQELLGRAPDHLRQFARDTQQQAQALTEEGLAKFRATAQKASDSVDETARTAGGTLRGAASGMRSYAPESGAAADLTERLASGLEHSAVYLERRSESGILASMADFLRRHPIATMLAGGGIVLLLLRGRRRG
jgi:hypothetical protein